MKNVAVAALAVVLALALAPRSPQAADVERVQRACDRLRAQYGNALGELATTRALNAYAQRPRPEYLVPIIDARAFDLFCAK